VDGEVGAVGELRLTAELPRLTYDCRRSVPAGGDVHFGTGLFAEDGTLPRRHRPRLSCRPVDRARQVFTDELTDVLGDPARPANAEVLDGWFLVYHRDDDVVDRRCGGTSSAPQASSSTSTPRCAPGRSRVRSGWPESPERRLDSCPLWTVSPHGVGAAPP
jgi:hypothetical protein